MSGVKVMSILAGAGPTSGVAAATTTAGGSAAIGAAGAGGGIVGSGVASGMASAAAAPTVLGVTLPVLASAAVVVAAGVGVTGAIWLGTKAFQAYQDRQRREQEAAEQREREIQQRIAEIQERVRSSSAQQKVTVKLPEAVTSSSQQGYTKGAETASLGRSDRNNVLTAAELDARREVDRLSSQMPKIKSEYQALIEQELLDAKTVNQALQKTEQALNGGNIQEAQAHLQALDDARIAVIQQWRSYWYAQIDYVQDRLDGVRELLPQAVLHNFQMAISEAQTNWQQITEAELQTLHQQISEFEMQADRIRETGENLVKAWSNVGYGARIVGIDNGDVAIEVETHEGVNTQMRVQFDGQQMQLFGPSEKLEEGKIDSCAARTAEVMQIFQEQGYYMEWDSFDNKPVPEEWRQFSAVASQAQASTEEVSAASAPAYRPSSSQRRLEGQGY